MKLTRRSHWWNSTHCDIIFNIMWICCSFNRFCSAMQNILLVLILLCHLLYIFANHFPWVSDLMHWCKCLSSLLQKSIKWSTTTGNQNSKKTEISLIWQTWGDMLGVILSELNLFISAKFCKLWRYRLTLVQHPGEDLKLSRSRFGNNM